MIRYYKLNNEVCAFDEADVADWVKPEMTEMTAEEVDYHLNPQKYMTASEKRDAYLASLPVLSKRQFALYLFDRKIYDQVMSVINASPRFKVEYDSVSEIERLSPTVSAMTALLGWTDEQVDQMWIQALTL